MPRELSRLQGVSQIGHAYNIKLVQAKQRCSKNIVLSHTALHQCVLSQKYISMSTLVSVFCPTGNSVYKDTCSAVRRLREQNHPKFCCTLLFDSSWWFRSSLSEVPWLKPPLTSSQFLSPSDRFCENSVHDAFASKVHARGRDLPPNHLLRSWERINWAGQR